MPWLKITQKSYIKDQIQGLKRDSEVPMYNLKMKLYKNNKTEHSLYRISPTTSYWRARTRSSLSYFYALFTMA